MPAKSKRPSGPVVTFTCSSRSSTFVCSPTTAPGIGSPLAASRTTPVMRPSGMSTFRGDPSISAQKM
jgi:hypothetical protein